MIMIISKSVATFERSEKLNFNGIAVWLVKPPTTATYETQTLIGFINYDRLLAVVI